MKEEHRLKMGSVIARIDDSLGPSACWPWTGSRNSGVPVLMQSGGNVRVRLFLWELTRNVDMPSGRQAKPSCGNHICVNPLHLCVAGFEQLPFAMPTGAVQVQAVLGMCPDQACALPPTARMDAAAKLVKRVAERRAGRDVLSFARDLALRAIEDMSESTQGRST